MQDFTKNTGFIAQDPRETDYIAGAVDIGSINNQTGDWSQYLPSGEKQGGVYFDSMACVSFSAINVAETEINYLLQTNQLPKETVAFLDREGYLVDGEVNFSDRFIAKLSGTTRVGNYLTTVMDTIRKYGLIPESEWTFDTAQRTPAFDWDDYYAPVPQALQDKGKKFLDYFDIKYSWLVAGGQAVPAQMKEWLKSGPLQIASATCPGWSTGDVNACSLPINHATMIYGIDDTRYKLFDHYTPFEKTLALDYKIPFVMRIIVTPKSVVEKPEASYDVAFSKKQAGKMLLAVEDLGSLWYVTPEGKRAKVGRKPEEVAHFLDLVNQKKVPVTGITNKDISKIEIV